MIDKRSNTWFWANYDFLNLNQSAKTQRRPQLRTGQSFLIGEYRCARGDGISSSASLQVRRYSDLPKPRHLWLQLRRAMKLRLPLVFGFLANATLEHRRDFGQGPMDIPVFEAVQQVGRQCGSGDPTPGKLLDCGRRTPVNDRR